MEVVCGSCDDQINCFNIRTGVLIQSWKGKSNKPLLNSKFMVAGEGSKPILNFWQDKKNAVSKQIVPEIMTAVCLTNKGNHVVGGGKSGRIYCWDIYNSKMLLMWDAHYKEITSLKFSIDDQLLISCSEDGSMKTWLFTDIISRAAHIKPFSTFSDHSLPITDCHVGFGLFPHGFKLFTCSLDKTVRSESNVIVFPRALTCLVVDALEVQVFAGSITGDIYTVGMNPGQEILTFQGHKEKVTGISLSMDETLLVSSSLDSFCMVWDRVSRACLRSFSQRTGPVTGIWSGLYFEDFSGVLKLATFEKYPGDDQSGERVALRRSGFSEEVKFDAESAWTMAQSLIETETSDDVLLLRKQVADLTRLNQEMFKKLI